MTEGGAWTGHAMAIDRSVPAPAGRRPGAWPVMGAIARGLVFDGLRIGSFLLGAYLLGSIAVGLVVFVLLWPEGPPGAQGAASRAAQEMAVTPLANLVLVAQVLAIAGYLGLRLPVRAIAASTIDDRTIRRAVAAIGAALIVVVSWLLLPMWLDWVLAVGYSAAPMVFAVAALRGPADPPVARGWRPYLVLAAAHAAWALGGVALWVAAPPVAVDLSAIGEPSTVLGDDAAGPDVTHWSMRSAERYTDVWLDAHGEPAVAVSSLRVEVWPATVRDGILVLGGAPLLSLPMVEDAGWAELQWRAPTPRVAELVVTVATGETPDGRRVILDEEPEIGPTPPWHGPLLWWWLGG